MRKFAMLPFQTCSMSKELTKNPRGFRRSEITQIRIVCKLHGKRQSKLTGEKQAHTTCFPQVKTQGSIQMNS